MVDEPEVGAAVARRFQHSVVPLHQAAGVGDRPVLLTGERGRQEEDLGADVLRPQLSTLHKAALLPEIRRLRHREVADHQPVQLCQAALDEIGVHRADDRILAEDELALHHAIQHRQRHRQLRHVAGQLGHELVAPLIVRPGVFAVPGLQQADDVFGHIGPPAGRRRLRVQIVLQRAVLVEHVRLRQVGGQHVVERRDVGAALDAGVAAQRQDAAAGTADIAQQALDDRGGADDLHADGVMRPADRVAKCPGLLPAGIARQGIGDGKERVTRAAGHPLHHLRRVARVVAPHDLVDAVRMLQRRIGRRRAFRHRLEVTALETFPASARRCSEIEEGTILPLYCQVSCL